MTTGQIEFFVCLLLALDAGFASNSPEPPPPGIVFDHLRLTRIRKLVYTAKSAKVTTEAIESHRCAAHPRHPPSIVRRALLLLSDSPSMDSFKASLE